MLNLCTLKHWLMRMGSNMKTVILSQAITHTTDDGTVLNLKAGANKVDDEVAGHWFVQHYIVDEAINTESDSKAIEQVQSLETELYQVRSEINAEKEKFSSAESEIADLKTQLYARDAEVAELKSQLSEAKKDFPATAPVETKAK